MFMTIILSAYKFSGIKNEKTFTNFYFNFLRMQIEMDYYKDKENKGKESVSTDTVNGYPKLMDMIRK